MLHANVGKKYKYVSVFKAIKTLNICTDLPGLYRDESC